MVTLPNQLLEQQPPPPLLEPPHKRMEPSLPLLEQLDPLLLLRCWSYYAAKSRKEKSEVLCVYICSLA
ncbi:hypothetical protein NC651_037251 [Populus alba x Populus x berolinensis]|nr:hypothetical protein NC651_037251 [Populus alba x Populus x berolinensis]